MNNENLQSRIMMAMALVGINLFSFELFARAPRVGDIVQYRVVSTYRSQPNDPVHIDRYTRSEQFLRNDRGFWSRRILDSGDRSMNSVNSRLSNAMVQKWSSAYRDCLDAGGKLETVVVPAGIFSSCHKSENGPSGSIDTWYVEESSEIVGSVVKSYYRQTKATNNISLEESTDSFELIK